jgi:adenylate cyclase class 2
VSGFDEEEAESRSPKEIEIKGWVDDYDALKTRLDREAELVGNDQKRDLYYGPEDKGAGRVDLAEDNVFRLRNTSGRWLVTAKVRHFDPHVEISDEVEFEVSCASSFRAFARYLGYRPFVVKRKVTRSYRIGDATVELSRIDPLGDFLEVERLLEGDADPHEIKEAAQEVKALLLQLGIRESRIEPRPYIDMLRKVGAGRPDVR